MKKLEVYKKETYFKNALFFFFEDIQICNTKVIFSGLCWQFLSISLINFLSQHTY